MASTYLSKTFGSAGDQQIMTISFWMKRSALSGTNEVISQGSGSACHINLQSSGTMEMNLRNSVDGASNVFLITSRLFRDTSSWYHVVLSLDTTQATASNRAKLYINGVQETSFGTENYPSQNGNLFFNEASAMQIGEDTGGSDFNFDGALAHFHFIDGTAYDADTFGETDSTTGEWKPKTSPSVTYGTNGFFLKFENASSFGEDSSGNDNDFTSNGSPTQLVDTPTNVLATYNPLNNRAVLDNCNTSVDGSTDGSILFHSSSTLGADQGKWYMEFKSLTTSNKNGIVGVTYDPAEQNRNNHYIGQNTYSWGYSHDGNYYHNTSATSYGDTWTGDDILGIAMDLDNNYLYFSKNGVWQNSGDPTSGATGTGGIAIDSGETYFFATGDTDVTYVNAFDGNFGNGYFGTTAVTSGNQDDAGYGTFEYDVPTGYYTLNTKNINTYG